MLVIYFIIFYVISLGINYLFSKFGYLIPIVGFIIASIAGFIFTFLKTIGLLFLIVCVLCTLEVFYF
jgi:hypothetical protein